MEKKLTRKVKIDENYGMEIISSRFGIDVYAADLRNKLYYQIEKIDKNAPFGTELSCVTWDNKSAKWIVNGVTVKEFDFDSKMMVASGVPVSTIDPKRKTLDVNSRFEQLNDDTYFVASTGLNNGRKVQDGYLARVKDENLEVEYFYSIIDTQRFEHLDDIVVVTELNGFGREIVISAMDIKSGKMIQLDDAKTKEILKKLKDQHGLVKRFGSKNKK